MNTSPGSLGDVPWDVVTETSTGPIEPAGEVAVIWVPESTVTDPAAVVPKSTSAPGANPVPVTVTAVPPDVGPASGLTPVTAGVP